MAHAKRPDRTYYVYILFREDAATPFYVGMGRGDRWLEHEKYATKKRSHKNHIVLNVLSACGTVPKRKTADNLTKAEAPGAGDRP